MQTGTKMVRVPDPEIQVPANDIINILLVDDEPSVRESLSLRLERTGYAVCAVPSLEMAERKLAEMRFQVVILDVVLPGEITGDRFVMENLERLESSRIILITGWGLDRIQNVPELAKHGIEILKKGMPEYFDRINKAVTEKLEEEKNRISHQVKEMFLAPRPSALSAEVQDIFVRWLSSRQEPEKKAIYFGGKMYSPHMLVEEIEKGTPVGKAHLEMFLDLVKHSLGLSE